LHATTHFVSFSSLVQFPLVPGWPEEFVKKMLKFTFSVEKTSPKFRSLL
jgi:hypothetical protein